MKPHVLLRISAVLLAVFAVGHTFGVLSQHSAGPAEDAVVAAMRGYQFDMMGTPRTLWDFFLGGQWFMSAGAFVMVVALWQAGTLARQHGTSVRPLVVLLALGAAAYAVLSWRFFFIAPLVSCALSALFAGAAALRLGSAPEVAPAPLQP
ncbi:hypothetical protein FGE12_29295 [Aggregicoccus sp. 17bor-14]|uniref:LIC_13387 family protein n=1 Tax=Myxococcaceae TaxID=31 RepID=UPI00129D17AC|nr:MULTISPECIES: hypothetical protein [Myxococcaceae]MBF5046548.1 hypothetical protein [Simulacricoccus sp. 17bor-14]MRI92259.1 hypothetical protein [Aggregicoccus sp. 17bor-14]